MVPGLSFTLNPFLAIIPILYPLKNPKNFCFSGGMKWEHWPENRTRRQFEIVNTLLNQVPSSQFFGYQTQV